MSTCTHELCCMRSSTRESHKQTKTDRLKTHHRFICSSAGYEKLPDGTYSNDKVFPKWREKYPEPPDVIGVQRNYTYSIDRPSQKANQALVASIPEDHKQVHLFNNHALCVCVCVLCVYALCVYSSPVSLQLCLPSLSLFLRPSPPLPHSLVCPFSVSLSLSCLSDCLFLNICVFRRALRSNCDHTASPASSLMSSRQTRHAGRSVVDILKFLSCSVCHAVFFNTDDCHLKLKKGPQKDVLFEGLESALCADRTDWPNQMPRLTRETCQI